MSPPLAFYCLNSLLAVLLTAGSMANGEVSYGLEFVMRENNQAGQQIGRLDRAVEESPDNVNTQWIARNADLRYRLREASDLFDVDAVTSMLTARNPIDLEKLCPKYCPQGSERAEVDLIVTILQGEKPSRFVGTINVKVRVEDEDDNLPQFLGTNGQPLEPPCRIRLIENRYSEGKRVDLPEAIDRDVKAAHSSVSYRLDPDPSDPEAIRAFDLDTSAPVPRLILRQTMDFEQRPEYRFVLVAYDAQSYSYNAGAKSTRLPILIQVINENDMEPHFDQRQYEVVVPENTPSGSVVFTVSPPSGNLLSFQKNQ